MAKGRKAKSFVSNDIAPHLVRVEKAEHTSFEVPDLLWTHYYKMGSGFKRDIGK